MIRERCIVISTESTTRLPNSTIPALAWTTGCDARSRFKRSISFNLGREPQIYDCFHIKRRHATGAGPKCSSSGSPITRSPGRLQEGLGDELKGTRRRGRSVMRYDPCPSDQRNLVSVGGASARCSAVIKDNVPSKSEAIGLDGFPRLSGRSSWSAAPDTLLSDGGSLRPELATDPRPPVPIENRHIRY